ncbi:DNA recombination protein RmuC [Prevotella sp. oral taxon 376]|uniref:DNA recombination protein RmuC n=1 Tax=Prevotella sp. oral taxon 376 TaxID=712466 RepID=UPI000D1D5B89|nr:DNA recombination protein RmuC [Prevotella sp. oral taxon 376]PTL32888.1 DNA recombination protein RmuC [Prevotella sp. oral taxon 376]
MEIVYIAVGLVVGGLMTFLWMNGKKREVETALRLSEQGKEHEIQLKEELQAKFNMAEAELRDLSGKLTQAKVDLGSMQSQLEAERKSTSEENKLRREQFEQQLKTLHEQFSNLAQEVLDKTSDKLKTQNVNSIDAVTKPLKDKVAELQEAIKNTNEKTVETTSSITEQIRQMMLQTQRMDKTATRLSNVMQGGNKIQGNWGEHTLRNLLLAQGMREGTDFDLQVTVTAEGTDSYRPDAVLHYPNGEDVFIDAKMSIDAYKHFVEAEDDASRKVYAKKVVESVKGQYKNLMGKDYSRFVKEGRTAVDFVIMYVPYEGALQLSFKEDPNLWSEAFNNKVFITSQENLMAVLKVIDIAWRQYQQAENQKQVFLLADELLKRVGKFIGEYQKMKRNLDTFTKSFEGLDTTVSGRQGIVQKANQMKSLGVKENVNYPIPVDTAAPAELPEET